MAKELTKKSLVELISAKTGLSINSVTKIYDTLIETMLSELKARDYINLEGLGKFRSVSEGGSDEWFYNSETNTQEKRYVEEFKFVEYIPNKVFINNLNDIPNNDQKIKKNKYHKSKDTVTKNDLKEEKAKNAYSTEAIIDMIMAKKRKERETMVDSSKTTWSWKSKPIKCLNNGKSYASIYLACKDLQLRYDGVAEKARGKNIGDRFDYLDYMFVFIEKDEEENKE